MILYLVVVFFIIIFNILIPNIIQKLKITNSIFESENGQKISTVSCLSNYWMYIDKTIAGIKISYFMDDKQNILTCDKKFSNTYTAVCGKKGEYNNRYHPCYIALSNLLFYKIR